MPTDLTLIRLRLRRAQERLRDFNHVEAAFLSSKPYSLSVKFDRKTGEYVLWFHVREAPPLELSLILSECTHHLRAVLDNAVCAIADQHGGGADRYTAMPICLEPKDWRKRGTKRRIARIPSRVYPTLQDLQPYKRLNKPMVKFDFLYLLDELWNADKHHALVLTLGSTPNMKFRFSKPTALRWFSWDGFDKDGPVCRVAPLGWTPRRGEGDLQYKLHPPFRVGFGPGGPYQNGLIVAICLRRLDQFVRSEAIPKLRPFLV